MAYGRSSGSEKITFTIVNRIGVLSESKSGWKTELNMVSWNDKEPKFDIRAWSPDHTKMGKGITMTESEMKQLVSVAGRFMATGESEDMSSDSDSDSDSGPGNEDHEMDFDNADSAYFMGGHASQEDYDSAYDD